MVSTLNLTFEDKEFKRLSNAKECEKILGNCSSWEEYFLKLAKIRK